MNYSQQNQVLKERPFIDFLAQSAFRLPPNPELFPTVQAASNPPGGWTTLGRAANTVTNFGFSNWSVGQQQFYRLVVP